MTEEQKNKNNPVSKNDSPSDRGKKEKPADNRKEGKSVYAKKRIERKRRPAKRERSQDEYEQRLVDIARVTRVMAGGKRMRFRACVVLGNRNGKVGFGIDKGADVTIAVNKAVNQAKKNMIDISIVNETIPHEIYHKLGAAKILLKPARKGKGVIAGGAARTVLELAGINNVTSKILGTNNKVNIVRSTIEALTLLRKVENKAEKEKNPAAGNSKEKVLKNGPKQSEKKSKEK